MQEGEQRRTSYTQDRPICKLVRDRILDLFVRFVINGSCDLKVSVRASWEVSDTDRLLRLESRPWILSPVRVRERRVSAVEEG